MIQSLASSAIPAARGTFAALAVALLSASPATGQAQRPIPIRQLVILASTDSGIVANVNGIHATADGNVLLNDGLAHRLLLFDATLKRCTVLADSAHLFGAAEGGLLPFPGDSVAFIDRASQALVIVGASGTFGRVTAPPKVTDVYFFADSAYGAAGFDSSGRLYYRTSFAFRLPPAKLGAAAETTHFSVDSAPIIRADFDARRLDTVALMRTPMQRSKVIRSGGGATVYQVINPLPYTDEWAYLTDGTVAIVRGQDYHMDWILPNGTHESTPRMPFDWRRVTDDEKRRMVDSAQHELDSARTALIAKAAVANPSRSVASLNASVPRREVLRPDELPDYYPPVRASSQMRVDPDGNLWILPTTSLQAKGGLLYDVVTRTGEILERVQFPEGRSLAGFGARDIVYMKVPSQYSWVRLERARIIQ